jgi:hypothetical protein
VAITHTNRKGDTYYLHRGRSRAGQATWFFSRKSDGDLADAIPPGYEVHEKPQGQVFLRKALVSAILPLEVAQVEAGLRRAGLRVFRTDVEKDAVVVYLPDSSYRDGERLMSEFHRTPNRERIEAWQWGTSFSAMMRFVLRDPESRRFEVQRWCFRGSIDGWTYALDGGDLAALVARYAPHLGKESFFDLM